MVTAMAAVLIALAYEGWQRYAPPAAWSDDEINQIASLWIGRLPHYRLTRRMPSPTTRMLPRLVIDYFSMAG